MHAQTIALHNAMHGTLNMTMYTVLDVLINSNNAQD